MTIMTGAIILLNFDLLLWMGSWAYGPPKYLSDSSYVYLLARPSHPCRSASSTLLISSLGWLGSLSWCTSVSHTRNPHPRPYIRQRIPSSIHSRKEAVKTDFELTSYPY